MPTKLSDGGARPPTNVSVRVRSPRPDGAAAVARAASDEIVGLPRHPCRMAQTHASFGGERQTARREASRSGRRGQCGPGGEAAGEALGFVVQRVDLAGAEHGPQAALGVEEQQGVVGQGRAGEHPLLQRG